MSFADLWDRTFWSIMVVIGIGLLWIIFVEPYGLSCAGPGLIVALLAGGFFFYLGVRGKMRPARAAENADGQDAAE
jgi:hypothetical protein